MRDWRAYRRHSVSGKIKKFVKTGHVVIVTAKKRMNDENMLRTYGKRAFLREISPEYRQKKKMSAERIVLDQSGLSRH